MVKNIESCKESRFQIRIKMILFRNCAIPYHCYGTGTGIRLNPKKVFKFFFYFEVGKSQTKQTANFTPGADNKKTINF